MGPAGSGKSVIAKLGAQFFRDNYFIQSLVVSMADPLKKGLTMMGLDKDRDPKLFRALAQFIGTDVFRNSVCEHWWVYRMTEYLRNETPQPSIIFIDDIRFANETSIPDLLFRVVPGFQPNIPSIDDDLAQHESEVLGSLEESDIPRAIRESSQYAGTIFNRKDNPQHALTQLIATFTSRGYTARISRE